MRKATTTNRSGFHAFNAAMNSGSFSDTGCSTGIPCSTAYFFTALSLTFSPLPLALSATVTTPAMWYPLRMSSSSGATANSGVPIYTILVFFILVIIFIFSFVNHVFMLSVLKMDESFIAFQVRKMPIGNSTYDDMKTPAAAEMAPSLASFVPEMSITQYATKKSTEMMAGVPSPPFLMRAPSGAPMKKNMKHAIATANFFSFSTSILLRVYE